MYSNQPLPTNTVEGPESLRIESEATVSRNDFSANRSLDLDPAPPQHPMHALQAAFEESIMESAMPSPKKLKEKLSAEARRRQLLELNDNDHEYSSRWTQRPGAKFHPLWKLIAQISFGIHLLHKNLAKSEDEVVRILQGHVDEVDSFAEDTTADFDLAIRDIKERIQYLLLPLEHSRTFNKMLCDKSFRASILDGNDIIERVIQRTRTAMDRSLGDAHKGIEAVGELSKYLERLGNDWSNQDGELLDAYHVMRGNAEGWYRCFLRLQAKGEHLGDLMIRLESILDEVALRAGIASRRKTPTGVVGRKKRLEAAPSAYSIPNTVRSSTSSAPTQRHVDKPLPTPPARHSPSASRSSNAPLTDSTVNEPPHSPTSRVSNAHLKESSTIAPPHSPSTIRNSVTPLIDSTTMAPPHDQSASRTSIVAFTNPSADAPRTIPFASTIFAKSSSLALSPITRQQSLSRDFRTSQKEITVAPSSMIVPTTIHMPTTVHITKRSPIGNTPKSATDSAYSSCAETPMPSPHKHEQNSRTSFSTFSSAPVHAPRPDENAKARIKMTLSPDIVNQHDRNYSSEEPVTALPIFREPFPGNNKLRKSSLSMKHLFSKKQSRKDMSGGVGGCVVVT